jgi:hypothetical protein
LIVAEKNVAKNILDGRPYLVFLGLGNSTVSLYLKIWPDKKGTHEGWWLAAGKESLIISFFM